MDALHRLAKTVKDLSIFVEGPDDDSNGIKTYRFSPMNNVNDCCV